MAQGTDWPGETQQTGDSSGIDLRAILWERKWLLIFFGIVGASLGYLQFTRQPASFRSDADVLVQHSQARLPVDNFANATAKNDPIDTHIALFHTPVLLEEAVKQFHLDSLPSLAGTNSPMQAISARLSVYRSPSSEDILHFAYTSGNRSDSQRILEAVIAAYLDYLGASQKSLSDKNIQLITKAKDELTDDLAKKEKVYQAFRESASLLWAGEEGRNIHQARLAEIESQRSSIMIQITQVKAELDAIKQAIEQGVSRQSLLVMADQAKQRAGAGSSGTTTQRTITGQLIPLMLEEALLLETLGKKHPQVLEVRTKIEVMQRLLQKEAGDPADANKPRPDLLTIYLQSLQEEMRIGNEKIKELDTLFLAEKKSSKEIGSEENQNRALREDLERTKGLFNVIVEQLAQNSLSKDNITLSGEIVNQPNVAVAVQSKMYSYIGIGGVLGMVFGMGMGVLLEFGDKRFRSPEEMMQTIGAPILGHIPEMASGRRLKKLKDDKVAPTVANYHRPQSRIAEAYRLIRTSLLFEAKQGECSVIQFTSPDPGDGKSTCCSNVAVAIANSGKRVLVLDADLRRPMQHNLFGLDRNQGLSSILIEGVDSVDAIQKSAVENLDILTAGSRTDHPSELLHSQELAILLESIKPKYDFILLDSPPVLAVTDATALSAQSDAVLMVVKNTKHCKPRAKQARESLDLVSARVMGVVVNFVSEETSYRYEAGQYKRGLYGNNYGYGGGSYQSRAYRGYYATGSSHDVAPNKSKK